MSKIDDAKEKVRTEAEGLKGIAKMLSRQVSDLITSEDRAEKVLKDGKNLKDLKKKFDDYAGAHKEGNESAFGPDAAEVMINEFYGFKEERPAASNVIDITDFML